jgi:hypothetical protein
MIAKYRTPNEITPPGADKLSLEAAADWFYFAHGARPRLVGARGDLYLRLRPIYR